MNLLTNGFVNNCGRLFGPSELGLKGFCVNGRESRYPCHRFRDNGQFGSNPRLAISRQLTHRTPHERLSLVRSLWRKAYLHGLWPKLSRVLTTREHVEIFITALTNIAENSFAATDESSNSPASEDPCPDSALIDWVGAAAVMRSEH
jgi:hypothetical protein